MNRPGENNDALREKTTRLVSYMEKHGVKGLSFSHKDAADVGSTTLGSRIHTISLASSIDYLNQVARRAVYLLDNTHLAREAKPIG